MVTSFGTGRRFRLKANIIIIEFYAIAGKAAALRPPNSKGNVAL